MSSFSEGKTTIDCGDNSKIEITPTQINLITPLLTENGSQIIGEKGDKGDTGPQGEKGESAYDLISSQTVLNATTVTFSGLNGDSDVEYRFKYDLTITTTADSYLQMEPNGLTSNQKYSRLYSSNYNGTSDQGTNVGSSYMLLTQSGWSKSSLVSGEMIFKATSGQIRRGWGQSTLICTDFSEMGTAFIGNYWGDTTTNITSFVLALTGSATMTGTIKLYKVND